MKLCLGTVQFGMDYGVQGAHRQSYESIDQILRYALESGINLFDTAAVYGDAEEVIGHYIRHKGYAAEKMKVVTKLDAKSFDNAMQSEWSRIAVEKAEQSIAALGIKKLEAFLFHDASYIYNTDAVKALSEVRSNSLAENIGVSIYEPSEAMMALEYSDINVIQIPYNLFDHRLDKAGFFDRAKERNIKVYARSTLLQGLVVMDPQKLPDNMAFAKKYLYRFEKICTKYHISKLSAAISYVNRHYGIDYIIFGVDNLSQLKEYISAVGIMLPDEMIDEIEHSFDVVEGKLINPTLWK